MSGKKGKQAGKAATTTAAPAPAAAPASAPAVAPAAVVAPAPTSTPPPSEDATTTSPAAAGAAGGDTRHPLQHAWTMWYDSPTSKAPPVPGQQKQWASANKIISFDTVEDFWCLFNNLQPPSSLPQKANYWFFKEGIRPEWEDTSNQNGGRWTIEFEGKKDLDRMNKCWTYCVLAMIGEQFGDDGAQICGAVVSIRGKHNRLQLWTRDASPAASAACKRIGSTLKRLLDVKESIGYLNHSTSGFEARNLYEV